MRMAASLRTILALELKARSSPDAMTTIRELLLIEQRLALEYPQPFEALRNPIIGVFGAVPPSQQRPHRRPKCRNELVTPHEFWSPYHIIGAIPRCASQQIC